MQSICQHLQQIRKQIAESERKFGRAPGSVALLAVSKTHKTETLKQALSCGQKLFGESYLQEAKVKLESLGSDNIEWHFIGAIQSNKTRFLAENFNWIHSVDRLKVAQRLNQQRPDDLGKLNICLQVNVSNEASKAGIAPNRLIEFAKYVTELPRLSVRGLMALPKATPDFEQQKKNFSVVRKCLQQLHDSGFHLDTLSMGMSNDMEAAIAEGATIVRIGTAIFGPRKV